MARRGENIYHRKDGRWEGRYKSGYDESGKAKYRSVYGRSYMDVREKLAPLKASPPAPPVTCQMTVKELFSEWLSAIKLRVKTSTFANYLMKAEKHILPVFGGMRYDMLTVQMINNFIQEKLDSGLSAKYVSDIVIVFKSMSKYSAKIHEFRNTLADVELPKVHRSEAVLLTRNQQLHLCRYLQRNPCTTSLCVLLSLYTGLRVGEVCGLMWEDIDFEKSILTVRRTVQRIRNGNHRTIIIADSPKSRTSKHTIPIPIFLMKLLRDSRSNENCYILSGSIMDHLVDVVDEYTLNTFNNEQLISLKDACMLQIKNSQHFVNIGSSSDLNEEGEQNIHHLKASALRLAMMVKQIDLLIVVKKHRP
ncbi:MAG TPA: site-specific integrase [Ruminococcus sp.]|nr:site-specific integrase [Ruminococcus sp.]